MKLDKELFHKTQGNKTDFKYFDYKDNLLGSTGLKFGYRINKENQKQISCDGKESERDGLRFQFLMDDGDTLAAAELRQSKSLDDLKTFKEYQANDSVAPYIESSINMEPINKELEYYTDNSLMEYELPEFLVCYRENYHAVKDICVDEGLPQDNILFESDSDEKAVHSFIFPGKDPKEHNIKEQLELHMPVFNGLNSSEEKDSDKEFVGMFDLFDASVEGEDNHDKAYKNTKDVSKDKVVSLGELLSMKESTIENSYFVSSKKDGNVAEPQISQKTFLEGSALVPAAEESNNCTNATFEKDSSFSDELSYNSKIISSHNQHEFGSVAVTREDRSQSGLYGFHESENWSIGDDGRSDSHVVSGQVQHEIGIEERSQNDVHGCHETPNTSTVDGVTSDSEIVSSQVQHDIAKEEYPNNNVTERCESQNMLFVEEGTSGLQAISSQDQNGGQGESSFSGVHRLSSLINYSGPMASGNVSIRSESSTTSTRSFAFPILQPEWNSSPIRMVKSDRRHVRKHGGWRQGLLCCRF